MKQLSWLSRLARFVLERRDTKGDKSWRFVRLPSVGFTNNNGPWSAPWRLWGFILGLWETLLKLGGICTQIGIRCCCFSLLTNSFVSNHIAVMLDFLNWVGGRLSFLSFFFNELCSGQQHLVQSFITHSCFVRKWTIRAYLFWLLSR